jgi:hypothetical protein
LSKINYQDVEFGFGMPGCDNRIARIALDHGYNVTNPSLSIFSHHLHKSNHRTYKNEDRVRGEYHYIAPTALLRGRMVARNIAPTALVRGRMVARMPFFHRPFL